MWCVIMSSKKVMILCYITALSYYYPVNFMKVFPTHKPAQTVFWQTPRVSHKNVCLWVVCLYGGVLVWIGYSYSSVCRWATSCQIST